METVWRLCGGAKDVDTNQDGRIDVRAGAAGAEAQLVLAQESEPGEDRVPRQERYMFRTKHFPERESGPVPQRESTRTAVEIMASPGAVAAVAAAAADVIEREPLPLPPRAALIAVEAELGLGRIVALHHRSSTSCQIREHIRHLSF